MSTNEWVKCPYNHTHTMPQSTLQWHLVRCSDKRKNADNFSTCPYNATHIIIKSELTKHVMNCPDKKLFADTEEIVSHIKSIKENSSYVHTRMPWEADTDFWEIDDTKLVPGETPKETEYKNTSRPQKKKNAKKKRTKLIITIMIIKALMEQKTNMKLMTTLLKKILYLQFQPYKIHSNRTVYIKMFRKIV